MANSSNNASPRIVKKERTDNDQLDFVSYALKNGRKGRFLRDRENGRVEVVALYCNCGRSIFVPPKEVDETSVTCNDCNSQFRWQQLTFADLNAA